MGAGEVRGGTVTAGAAFSTSIPSAPSSAHLWTVLRAVGRMDGQIDGGQGKAAGVHRERQRWTTVLLLLLLLLLLRGGTRGGR